MHAGGTYLWDRLMFVITSSLKIQHQQILKQLFFVRHLSIVQTQHLSGVYSTTLMCNLKLYFHFILPRNSLEGKFSKPQNYIKDTIAQSQRSIKIVVCLFNIQQAQDYKNCLFFIKCFQLLYKAYFVHAFSCGFFLTLRKRIFQKVNIKSRD